MNGAWRHGSLLWRFPWPLRRGGGAPSRPLPRWPPGIGSQHPGGFAPPGSVPRARNLSGTPLGPGTADPERTAGPSAPSWRNLCYLGRRRWIKHLGAPGSDLVRQWSGTRPLGCPARSAGLVLKACRSQLLGKEKRLSTGLRKNNTSLLSQRQTAEALLSSRGRRTASRECRGAWMRWVLRTFGARASVGRRESPTRPDEQSGDGGAPLPAGLSLGTCA